MRLRRDVTENNESELLVVDAHALTVVTCDNFPWRWYVRPVDGTLLSLNVFRAIRGTSCVTKFVKHKVCDTTGVEL